MILKCKCGVESLEFEKSSNIGEFAERSGFGFVWDISKGLSAIWMCMTCRNEISKAWETIVQIAGTDLVQVPRFRKKD